MSSHKTSMFKSYQLLRVEIEISLKTIIKLLIAL